MSVQGLHEAVLAHLGPEITGGTFAQGDVIRLDQIESRFGVSRTVARETIKMLESLHMVESRRRVGIVVRPMTEWDLYSPRVIRWRLEGRKRLEQLVSIAQLRLGVEPLAAGLACVHATADQCGTLVGAVMGMTAASRDQDLDTYVHHDATFHRTILEASGNEMLAALAPSFEEVLTDRAYQSLVPLDPQTTDIHLHRDAADAVAARKPERAAAALREAVGNTVHTMEAALAQVREDELTQD